MTGECTGGTGESLVISVDGVDSEYAATYEIAAKVDEFLFETCNFQIVNNKVTRAEPVATSGAAASTATASVSSSAKSAETASIPADTTDDLALKEAVKLLEDMSDDENNE